MVEPAEASQPGSRRASEDIDLMRVGPGIHAFDSGYGRRHLDAVHIIENAGHAAFVDSGTQHSVSRALEALAQLGLGVEAVDWILLTHVHLDHAGGAGALLRELPNARLLVHPRGARHMIDPAKLWEGTVAVYGEQYAREAYGELVPAPAERVVEATDGMEIDLAGRSIEVTDTPGHARHHVCYFDTAAHGWFTGDTFGLSYRETHVGERAFVFPTTTPIQFDPVAFHASIDRMLARGPQSMYLTHYSRVSDVPRLAADLHRLIDAMVAIAEEARALEEGSRYRHVRDGLEALLRREAREQRWAVEGDAAVALYAGDLDLNTQGLLVWLKT
jgi:glyoxylase-like metal-dependent hydrolase (beta-lactamase superfamily II)